MDNIQLGKLPPQAIELEEAVLGILMIVNKSIVEVSDILKPEMFYKEDHQKIFEAIMQLYKSNSPVDSLTVMQTLRENGNLEDVGGAYFLTELTNRVAASASLEFYARVIQEKYILRELIKINTEGLKKAYEHQTDCFELIQEQQSATYQIIGESMGRDFVNVADIVPERLKEYEVKPSSDGMVGISSGVKTVDDITGGWRKSNLIILAGRPSMGKTAFALHLVRECAFRQSKPAAIFSLEMSKEELTDRIIAAETNVSISDISRKKLDDSDWVKLTTGLNTVIESKILIDDTPALTMGKIRAKALRMLQTHKIQLVMIDYLGLIKPEDRRNSNRTNDIGEISRSLKALAKELNVPVIALSQLSRKVEDRPGGSKKPRLADLRDSGDIEQDADIVMFVYRPEYYGLDQDEAGNSTEGQCQLMIEKHRNGALGTPYMLFDAPVMRFSGWNESKMDIQFNAFQEITLRPSSNFEYGFDHDDDPPF